MSACPKCGDKNAYNGLFGWNCPTCDKPACSNSPVELKEDNNMTLNKCRIFVAYRNPFGDSVNAEDLPNLFNKGELIGGAPISMFEYEAPPHWENVVCWGELFAKGLSPRDCHTWIQIMNNKGEWE